MNRLTRKSGIVECYIPINVKVLAEGDITDKLGKLEDILEKYGIESVEELEKLFEVVIQEDDKQFREADDHLKRMAYNFVKNKWNMAEQDRDTWKKACGFLAEDYLGYQQNLICDCVIEGGVLSDEGFNMTKKQIIDEAYTQAQKEMKDE